MLESIDPYAINIQFSQISKGFCLEQFELSNLYTGSTERGNYSFITYGCILTVLCFNGVCGGRSALLHCAVVVVVAVAVAVGNKPDCRLADGKDTDRRASSGCACPRASPSRCDRHNLSSLSAKWGNIICRCKRMCVFVCIHKIGTLMG